MPNSSPRSLTDIQLAAATTGRIVTRDSSGIALVTDALTVPILHHRAQPITSGFDGDVALTVSQTRDDGTDPGMDPGFPAPIGNVALGIRNPARENTPYRWPWYVSDDGAMAMGQAFTVSQMRRTNGSIIGCYGPGSIDVRPDGNWSCFRAGNSMHDPVVANPNAYCYGALDRDSADPRDSGGPYSVASGMLKWAVGPSGETWWGTWLVEDPEANRVAKLSLSTSTSNLTFESGAAATTTTVDIKRPSTLGVGVTNLAIGRDVSGESDLVISAVSSSTFASAVNFSIGTPAGAATPLTLFSRHFAGVDKVTTSVQNFFANAQDTARTIIMGVVPGQETLPGIWVGIDPTTQTTSNYFMVQSGNDVFLNTRATGGYSFKVNNAAVVTFAASGQIGTNAGLAALDTIIANNNVGAGRTPVRVGWSGNVGEEIYSGVWFTASPTLANFALLNVGTTTNVVNAPNGGTLQIRIANSSGANFSQASTDLDRSGVGMTVGGYHIQRAAAAPTTGTYVQGDIVYNTAPAASGFIGWVCVTSGSPGVWKTWGVISA